MTIIAYCHLFAFTDVITVDTLFLLYNAGLLYHCTFKLPRALSQGWIVDTKITYPAILNINFDFKGNQQMKLMAPSKVSLIDPDWETTDPCPDIHGLFLAFNNRFFYGCLVTVEVKWSQQMTS